ncbi:MAG: hypothetical protein QOJ07_1173 [Thermoleophilaceae bacterium]|nr:hypothetical protein [Thermoleophilaceae bacterium]
MAVPRPVLIAILGLALCVTALIAVHGLGGGDDSGSVPAPLPPAPTARKAPARGTHARAAAKPVKPAKPTKQAATAPAAPKPAKPAQATPVQPTTTQPAAPKAPAAPALSAKQRTLTAVAKALGQNHVVVLFFSRPGAADDTGTRSAVRKLRGMKGVEVFSPNFQDLADYRPILAGTGVSQVPSIVITKPGHKAQLVEGYVDRQSLRQQVEDALR